MVKLQKLSYKYSQQNFLKSTKKNQRQMNFKQITHKLDVEVFGIQFKKVRTPERKLGKI